MRVTSVSDPDRIRLAFLVAVAFVPMILEAVRSSANERKLRAAGALEPPDDVIGIMRLAYPASFLVMMAESWWRGSGWGAAAAAGAIIFVCAKALKYWAIATLGERWTFRVLVPPGSTRVTSGPYAVVRHPNYAAVAGELAGFALVAGAPVTGAAATIGFSALMLARIAVEERALRL
jgi:methyltransferase